MREEWSCVSMVTGEQFAMMPGISETLQLCVVSLDSYHLIQQARQCVSGQFVGFSWYLYRGLIYTLYIYIYIYIYMCHKY